MDENKKFDNFHRIQVATLHVNNKTYSIFEGINTVGRNKEAVVNVKHLNVSHNHAIIVNSNGNHHISDLKSSNGTFCENVKLIPFKLYELKDKANIKLGDVSGIYSVQDLNSNNSQNHHEMTQDLTQSFYGLNTQLLENTQQNIHDEIEDIHEAPTQVITFSQFKIPARLKKPTVHSNKEENVPTKENNFDVSSHNTENSADKSHSDLNNSETRTLLDPELTIPEKSRFEEPVSGVDNSHNEDDEETEDLDIHEVATQVLHIRRQNANSEVKQSNVIDCQEVCSKTAEENEESVTGFEGDVSNIKLNDDITNCEDQIDEVQDKAIKINHEVDVLPVKENEATVCDDNNDVTMDEETVNNPLDDDEATDCEDNIPSNDQEKELAESNPNSNDSIDFFNLDNPHTSMTNKLDVVSTIDAETPSADNQSLKSSEESFHFKKKKVCCFSSSSDTEDDLVVRRKKKSFMTISTEDILGTDTQSPTIEKDAGDSENKTIINETDSETEELELNPNTFLEETIPAARNQSIPDLDDTDCIPPTQDIKPKGRYGNSSSQVTIGSSEESFRLGLSELMLEPSQSLSSSKNFKEPCSSKVLRSESPVLDKVSLDPATMDSEDTETLEFTTEKVSASVIKNCEMNETVPDMYLAATQKINAEGVKEMLNETTDIYIAATQKINEANESDFYIAPTQEVVSDKQRNSKDSCKDESMDDLYLQPTQQDDSIFNQPTQKINLMTTTHAEEDDDDSFIKPTQVVQRPAKKFSFKTVACNLDRSLTTILNRGADEVKAPHSSNTEIDFGDTQPVGGSNSSTSVQMLKGQHQDNLEDTESTNFLEETLEVVRGFGKEDEDKDKNVTSVEKLDVLQENDDNVLRKTPSEDVTRCQINDAESVVDNMKSLNIGENLESKITEQGEDIYEEDRQVIEENKNNTNDSEEEPHGSAKTNNTRRKNSNRDVSGIDGHHKEEKLNKKDAKEAQNEHSETRSLKHEKEENINGNEKVNEVTDEEDRKSVRSKKSRGTRKRKLSPESTKSTASNVSVGSSHKEKSSKEGKGNEKTEDLEDEDHEKEENINAKEKVNELTDEEGRKSVRSKNSRGTRKRKLSTEGFKSTSSNVSVGSSHKEKSSKEGKGNEKTEGLEDEDHEKEENINAKEKVNELTDEEGRKSVRSKNSRGTKKRKLSTDGSKSTASNVNVGSSHNQKSSKEGKGNEETKGLEDEDHEKEENMNANEKINELTDEEDRKSVRSKKSKGTSKRKLSTENIKSTVSNVSVGSSEEKSSKQGNEEACQNEDIKTKNLINIKVGRSNEPKSTRKREQSTERVEVKKDIDITDISVNTANSEVNQSVILLVSKASRTRKTRNPVITEPLQLKVPNRKSLVIAQCDETSEDVLDKKRPRKNTSTRRNQDKTAAVEEKQSSSIVPRMRGKAKDKQAATTTKTNRENTRTLATVESINNKSEERAESSKTTTSSTRSSGKRKQRSDTSISDSNESSTNSTVSNVSTPKKQKLQANAELLSSSEKGLRKPRPKVVFTMMDNPQMESMIKQLGGSVVQSVESCTVLVTQQVKRSQKLLCAVGQGKPICSPKWIMDSKKAHEFLDPWDYILKDPEAEKKWNFSLEQSLKRSRDHKLLQDHHFQIQVNTAADVLKGAIEACGGKCITKIPSKPPKNTFVISSSENQSKYKKILKQHSDVKAIESEAVFDAVLRQELRFSDHYLS